MKDIVKIAIGIIAAYLIMPIIMTIISIGLVAYIIYN